MLEKLFQTGSNDYAGLIARLTLGIVFIPHGLQKLLGLFGGHGFAATVDFFSASGMPTPVAILIILGESIGALFLIIGFISRISALGLGLIMTGAILMVHSANGFFMNWFGNQQGEGFEYHLLAIGLSLIVIINGGGKWSVDESISK